MSQRLARLILIAALFAARAVCAHDGPGTSTPGTTEYWTSAAVSGAWYDAARSGEGLVLEMLPDGKVAVIWFTYPPLGEAGDQAWMLGVATPTASNTVRVAEMLRPVGARFGEAFAPGDVRQLPWGSVELTFHDCAHATFRYQGPPEFGSGERTLTRLTTLDEAECNGAREVLPNGARALSGLRSKSGAWYVPSRSGEGWFVEELPDGRATVYWFTYDELGLQRWIVGVGQRSGEYIALDQPFMTRGAHFGDAFRSSDVQFETFGTLELDFGACNALAVTYVAARDERGAAQRQAVRLTNIAGLPCIDGTPAPQVGSRWVERAELAGGRVSELAAATLGNDLYALGGFGDLQGFKRYSPAEDRWTTLPAMPDGRHHLAAFAFEGGVFYVGGESNGAAQPYSAGYRYDIAAARWDAVPELLPMFGSHAAVLHGRAYIGDGHADGRLQEFDPRLRRARGISPPLEFVIARDHSQVVAFLDEIWMIGGRFPEHGSVSIYDPASGRWRRGPSLNDARAGFAAAVVGLRLVVAGGEYLSFDPPFVVDSTEVYTAGDAIWRFGPRLPVPVHGVPAAVVNGRYFLVSGSTRAASAIGGSGRLFELEW